MLRERKRRAGQRSWGCSPVSQSRSPEHGEPVGLHDLRHSYIALALDAGLSIAQVSQLARHVSPRVTLAIYAGLSDRAKAEATTKLIDTGFGA